MGDGPPKKTALKVQCGTCMVVVNVPFDLVEHLLSVGQFTCPKCQQLQSINMTQEAKVEVWRKVKNMQGNNPSNTGAAALRNMYSGGGARDAGMLGMIDRAAAQGDAGRHGGGGRFEDMLNTMIEDADEEAEDDENGATFSTYRPKKLEFGANHPDPIVESASMAAVDPPDVVYKLKAQELIQKNLLSCVQLEAVIYACQRHNRILPSGTRAGFFIGDGAGVGKGRTLAGLVLENWLQGRRKHIWLSVATDLKLDAERDLADIGSDAPVFLLNKIPYGRPDAMLKNFPEGVMFLTYSSLIASSDGGQTRLEQLLRWCGEDFDGLIMFDECHKAKNLMPEQGSTPTRTGLKALELQERLPNARVLYCSATGASAARNMAYMVRLGLWGPNLAFGDFSEFLSAVQSRGLGTLQIVAMEMKAHGMYVSRMLSFEGAEFELVKVSLQPEMLRMYVHACRVWSKLRLAMTRALELMTAAGLAPNKILWRQFWATHQRFFRYMCLSAKVPQVVALTKKGLAEGKSIIIGLQSTGEARTSDVVAEKGSMLDDFVSGPRELLLKLVEDWFPLPGGSKAQRRAASKKNDDLICIGERKQSAPAPLPKKRKRNIVSYREDVDNEGADVLCRMGCKPDAPRRSQGCARGRSARHRPNISESSRPAKSQSSAAGASLRNGGMAADGDEDSDFQISDDDTGADDVLDVDLVSDNDEPDVPDDREQRYSGLCPPEVEDTVHRLQDEMLKMISNSVFPTNPLDAIIDELGGPEKVAEMTGRKARLVRKGATVQYENRNATGAAGATLELINIAEKQFFLDGEKRIAIISEAASAGISLHAERRQRNQQRRLHLTMEMPWSAERAVQQFGRSHRANQSSAPQYRLMFTELGGEMRFAAAVARRLLNMGALTQGDQRARNIGLGCGDLNYDSPWGRSALQNMNQILLEERQCMLPQNEIPACQSNETGLYFASSFAFFQRARAALLDAGIFKPRYDLSAAEIESLISSQSCPVDQVQIEDMFRSDVPRFLNRLLGIEPVMQRHIFEFYQAITERMVQYMKQDGTYDTGIVDIVATSITPAAPPQVLHSDPDSGAVTLYHKLRVDRGMSFECAAKQLQEHQPEALDELTNGVTAGPPSRSENGAHEVTGFWVGAATEKGGHRSVLLALDNPGSNPRSARIFRPKIGASCRIMKVTELKVKMKRCHDLRTVKADWDRLFEGANRVGSARVKHVSILTGSILPFWKHLESRLKMCRLKSERRLKVVKVTTKEVQPKHLAGVVLPESICADVVADIRSALVGITSGA